MKVACFECSRIRRRLREEGDSLRQALAEVDQLLVAAGLGPESAARQRIALARALPALLPGGEERPPNA